MGYSRKAYKSFSWMALLRVSSRLIAFIRLAFLARILNPTQFGVFGVATIVLSFLEVFTETGINVFLIQKKDNISSYINSAWVISIFRGIIIAFVLIISAPFIANFFKSPESQLIIYLIAIVPFVRGFINPSIIKAQKDIQFNKEFYIRATLLTVDAIVAITVAFVTKSAVSMALGLIISAMLEVILSFIFFKPRPRFSFDSYKLAHITSKGWWVTITGIFGYLAEYLDNIVVGRVLGTDSLGIYQNGYRLSTLTISELNEVVNRVTFPVYSKFSDDKLRLINAFKKVFLSSSGIAIALGVFMFIFAEQIVLIVLGDQWIQAIPIVRILSIYGIFRSIFGNFSALFLSLERQNYVAITTFVRLAALLIVILPLVAAYGIYGAAFAMLISILVEIPVLIIFYYKAKKL